MSWASPVPRKLDTVVARDLRPEVVDGRVLKYDVGVREKLVLLDMAERERRWRLFEADSTVWETEAESSYS